MHEPDGSTTSGEMPFIFHGSYTRSVDKKGRFNLPFRFRNSGGSDSAERYVVTDGPDGTLTLLPYGEWLKAFQKVRSAGSGKSLRTELRRLSFNSRLVEPDAQGRIMVSPELLTQVGNEEKVRKEQEALKERRQEASEVLGQLANGNAVTIVPVHAELTAQQAAELLNVSRSYLVKLLESDELEYTMVGTHHRIQADDVIRYRRTQDEKTRQAVADLTALGQELGT